MGLRQRIHIIGNDIDNVTMQETIERMHELVRERKSSIVVRSLW